MESLGKEEMEMLEWIPQSSTINLLSTAQIQPWYRSDTGDPQKQRQVICKSQYDQPQVFAEDKKMGSLKLRAYLEISLPQHQKIYTHSIMQNKICPSHTLYWISQQWFIN